ncbi:MAG: tRNA synthetases class I, catalytic domain-containing protein, partial [Olpidium bornovanus]
MPGEAPVGAVDDVVPLFESIGLAPQKAIETARNKKLAAALRDVISASALPADGDRKALGTLLYTLASTGAAAKDAKPENIAFVAKAIGNGKLASTDQVAAAVKYFQKRKAGCGTAVDVAEFDKECGVGAAHQNVYLFHGLGVSVSPAEIALQVSRVIEENSAQLVSERYQFVNKVFGVLRQLPDLRWANGQAVKEEFDAAILALLGPKDDRDAPKKKERTPKAAERKPLPESSINFRDHFAHLKEGEMLKLHKPGGNPQIKESLMNEHLAITGGRVRTRFPPEPNGFLHIGHAKAINVNFGYAKIHGGTCYLRYDDTNPEAEEQVYFDSILETVRWLGFEPDLVTYSSDHFQRLYDLAVELIRRDKAYVCHCTGEEIFEQRGGASKGPRYACKHRNRPLDESAREFGRMRDGHYKEGEATLRMKMDLENPNPQFWDLVAYRVLNSHHHRTGDKWVIYPTYDYTHCLCDSFEHITHSMCTLEFRLSRESYYWLCDALEVYKPVQWEYGRLNITRTMLSKRKILQLVEEGIVRGWDDPRLYTLPALRRRGVPPEAINNFVREVGVTTATTITDVARLDNHVR